MRMNGAHMPRKAPVAVFPVNYRKNCWSSCSQLNLNIITTFFDNYTLQPVTE